MQNATEAFGSYDSKYTTASSASGDINHTAGPKTLLPDLRRNTSSKWLSQSHPKLLVVSKSNQILFSVSYYSFLTQTMSGLSNALLILAVTSSWPDRILSTSICLRSVSILIHLGALSRQRTLSGALKNADNPCADPITPLSLPLSFKRHNFTCPPLLRPQQSNIYSMVSQHPLQ